MLENKEIVEKIRTICRDKDTSITKLEESAGWSNGYVGKWAKAKKRPSIEKLSVVAEFLGVPIAELTGEDIKKPDPQEGAGKMPRGYDDLTPKNKAFVESMIAQLLASQSDD